jgi:hypothetical protein
MALRASEAEHDLTKGNGHRFSPYDTIFERYRGFRESFRANFMQKNGISPRERA